MSHSWVRLLLAALLDHLTSDGAGGRGPWPSWASWAAGRAGVTSGVSALLVVSKAAVGSGGTMEETVTAAEVNGGHKSGGGGGGGSGEGSGEGSWDSLCWLCC